MFLDDEFDETSLLESCNLDERNESGAIVSRDASAINGNTIFFFFVEIIDGLIGANLLNFQTIRIKCTRSRTRKE